MQAFPFMNTILFAAQVYSELWAYGVDCSHSKIIFRADGMSLE